ncbi:MAG: DUF4190 domain-containing protein [Bacteroidia bacterium]|nr:DUF4190 domain-containing protein [Bacteroidia bacterium]
MKFEKLYIPAILFLMLSLLSCSTFQKRIYRGGYYISANKKTTTVSRVTKPADKKSKEVLETGFTEIVKNKTSNFPEQVFIPVHKASELPLRKFRFGLQKQVADSCGDIIIMQDGSEITAKVLEVGTNTISYKPCNDLNGPLIMTGKNNVFMIKYKNGTKEIFKKQEPPKEPMQIITRDQPVIRHYNAFGIVSFICSCFFFSYVSIPLGIVFGIISLIQFNKYPSKYKGKWMPIFGIVFSIIVALVLIALIIGVV